MKEIWKDIEELDSDYQISNLGRIKSKERIVEYPYQNTYRKRKIKEKIVKLSVYKTGNRIDFQKFVTRKQTFLVSHLVYKYFIDDSTIPKNMCIAHRNKNPLDNKVNNLVLVSWSDSRKIDFKKSILTIEAQRKRSIKGANAMKKKAFMKKIKWFKPE